MAALNWKAAISIIPGVNVEVAGEADGDRGGSPKLSEIENSFEGVRAAIRDASIANAAHRLSELGWVAPPNDKIEIDLLYGRAMSFDNTAQGSYSPTQYVAERDLLLREIAACAQRTRLKAIAALSPNYTQNTSEDASAGSPTALSVDHPQPTDALFLKSVALQYPRQDLLLKGVDLAVARGSIVGLIGRNGSGKTSLLHAISGDLIPIDGTIQYPYLEAEFKQQRAKILNKVHLVPQAPPSWPGTVEGSLRLYASLRGHTRVKDSKGGIDFVTYVMRLMRLKEYSGFRCSQLSFGYKVRYELARAMLSRASILLLDEPLGQLDAAGKREYMRHLRTLAEGPTWNMAILISAQDSIALSDLTDNILVVHDRQLVLPTSFFEANGTKVVELVTRAEDREIVEALEALPGIEASFNVVPTRLSLPHGIEASAVVEALSTRRIEVLYMRDITHSPERLLGIVS